MTDEIDLEIEKAVKASVEAFMKSNTEEEEPKKDDSEEKKDDSEEKKDEKSEEKSEKPDFGAKNEGEAPKNDEKAPETPVSSDKIDVKSMTDDELVEFIEIAAQRMGLDEMVDEEPGLDGAEMPPMMDETA